MIEIIRRFLIFFILQAVCLLKNNSGDLIFRGCYIFNIINIVFKRQRFNAVFSNYIFYFVCGFKSIPVINIFIFF